MSLKIYLASSWRNEQQQSVLKGLRDAGHEVYDFKNPPNRTGFSWKQVLDKDPPWSAEQTINVLSHEVAAAGFESDFSAMRDCDVCVMLQPCGRSAALELGWCAGAGKYTIALLADGQEPELMLKMADALCSEFHHVLAALAQHEQYLKSIGRGPIPEAPRVPESELQFHVIGDPEVGECWQHRGTGVAYLVRAVSLDSNMPSRRLVTYYDVRTEKNTWTRDLQDFLARFRREADGADLVGWASWQSEDSIADAESQAIKAAYLLASRISDSLQVLNDAKKMALLVGLDQVVKSVLDLALIVRHSEIRHRVKDIAEDAESDARANGWKP